MEFDPHCDPVPGQVGEGVDITDVNAIREV